MDSKRQDCIKYAHRRKPGIHLITLITICLLLTATGQTQANSGAAGASALYRQLLNPVLNHADVHTVRNVAIDREDLHVVLSDGKIALMQSVDGHVVGAFFEGEGEILLVPPNRAERTSLALFTKRSVLDEHFTVAYLHFFDDKLAEELKAGFRPAEDAQEFVDKWQQSATSLARPDSLHLLQAIINSGDAVSRFIHLRLAGTALGLFDVYFNTSIPEQISIAQATQGNNTVFYDTWTSFAMRSARDAKGVSARGIPIHISDFRIHAKILPSKELSAEAELTLVPKTSGQKTFLLELSRYLKVSEIRMEGRPVTFIQNEAVDGSELARRGNDLVAVILPEALEKDHAVKLTVKYSGSVMFDAGGGVLYVGARGTWYPNVGPSFANFDLTFEYPGNWTLVATGKRVSSTVENNQKVTRFVSDRPLAHAGFNLGDFETETASAGNVAINSHATRNIESTLAQREARAGFFPVPAREVERTARQAATTVQFLSTELDPFPYSTLEVTQLPALLSQSWPGLIYLSSLAFLTPQERIALGVRDPYMELLFSELMLTHETAHQWWGDAVNWESYRDEWIIEALANYSALLMLEHDNPEKMKLALDHYRGELVLDTPNGVMDEAGPVTLGERLMSSRFPQAYEPVLYGRGTWLIHMLRSMLRQASGGKNDALFFKALKGLLAKSPNGKISTRDLQRAFEEVLPAELTYEGQKKLDWFFDGWVNGVSVPQFALEDVRVTPAGRQVKVSGVIQQHGSGKDLVTAVPLYAVDAAGKSQFLAHVFVDEQKTDFTVTAPAGTKTVLLDPDRTILRR